MYKIRSARAGASGTAPEGPPSRVFAWAGQLVSRSGFDRDAHWSFFDFGPWGIGHQHQDKLHLSVAAFGRDLLVDAGRFAYSGELAERFRRYAVASAGHNVLSIDGRGQGPGPREVDAPADGCGIDARFDWARGAPREVERPRAAH